MGLSSTRLVMLKLLKLDTHHVKYSSYKSSLGLGNVPFVDGNATTISNVSCLVSQSQSLSQPQC